MSSFSRIKGERYRALCYYWQDHGGQGKNSVSGAKVAEIVEHYEELANEVAHAFVMLPSLLKTATQFTLLRLNYSGNAHGLDEETRRRRWKHFNEKTRLALQEAKTFLRYPERFYPYWKQLKEEPEIFLASLSLFLRKAAYLEKVPDLKNIREEERLRLFARFEEILMM